MECWDCGVFGNDAALTVMDILSGDPDPRPFLSALFEAVLTSSEPLSEEDWASALAGAFVTAALWNASACDTDDEAFKHWYAAALELDMSGLLGDARRVCSAVLETRNVLSDFWKSAEPEMFEAWCEEVRVILEGLTPDGVEKS